MMTEKSFNILFVCSGNSCRTPMVEGLMKIKIPPEFQAQVSVASAGTLGIYDSPATPHAIEVVTALGADISEHRSQGVTEELMEEADLVFAMAIEHMDYLQRYYPHYRENVFLLRSFDRPRDERRDDSIDDPIGGRLGVYRKCAALINAELERILPRMSELFAEKLRSEDPSL